MNEIRTAVLLLQMGGPASVEEIRPFLRALFSDPAIVPLPGPPPFRRALAFLISTLRGRRVAGRYRAIGGGSPLGRITAAQAAALEKRLGGEGSPVPVRPVMRYAEPRAARVADALRREGVSRVIALSLYPHYSRTTTGSSLDELREVLGEMGGFSFEAVDRWGDDEGYLALLTRWTGEAVAAVRREAGDDVRVLFSAHGLPEKLIDAGDPYRDEVERTFAAVVARLPGVSCGLSFQSRIGPVKWIGPETGEAIDRLASDGARGLVVVPLGFVSDHIETLYDLDIVHRERARRAGIPFYRRLPSFNDDPGFIDVLGGLLAGRLPHASPA
jgi:ferrochelatase